MSKYHPILVVLHWLMIIPIFGLLIIGSVVMDNIPVSDPEKNMALTGHMSIGMAVGLLLILRLIVRITSKHPPKATTGNDLLDKIGIWTHWAFYLLIGLMVLSGLGIAFSTGLFPIIFGGSGENIPAELDMVPPRIAHGIISKLLFALIIVHILAAFYHQFLLKDGLLRRMWFGKRQ